MGASGWSLVVDFDGDEDKLITTLHEETWRTRRFEFPLGEIEFLEEIEFFAANEEELKELADQYGVGPMLPIAKRVGIDNLVGWYNERAQTASVETLEELRAVQCVSADGTHSPLDIVGVAKSPQDFSLCRLTDDQIVTVFGKAAIDRADIREPESMYVSSQDAHAYSRWQAVYAPLHTDGHVTHAYVEGATGD